MELTDFFILIVALFSSYLVGLIAKRYFKQRNLTLGEGLGTIEGALLALFAFFLGFTFSISASKIETVRVTSVYESNAIGTALLRIDLYDEAEADEFNKLFKSYLKSRVDYFSAENSDEDNQLHLDQSYEKSAEIWNYAVTLQKNGKTEASRLMLPALNDMIDAISSRDSTISSRLPNAIIYTLYTLCILSCFIVGFSTKRGMLEYLVGLIYIVIVALTVNLILDASDPRKGYINTDRANQSIVEEYESLP